MLSSNARSRLYPPACFLWALAAVLAPPVRAQAHDWPYDDEYQDRLIFIHPLVNYAFSPYWERDWERNLLSGTGVRFTVGSITTRDFLIDGDVNVSERLGDTRFRFVYRMDWLEAQHVEADGLDQLAGFEMSVAGPLGIEAVVQPAGDKEFADMAVGIVLADSSRARYLRASFRFDDLVWGQKNDREGTYDRRPLALEWTGRYDADSWELFTHGRLMRAYARAFPDTIASPGVSAERRGASWANLRARYLTTSNSFAEVDVSWYDFEDAETAREAAASYDYANRIITARARWAVAFGGGAWRAWPGIQLLVQDAAAAGRRDYVFDRVDWLPSAFVEWFASSEHSIDVGYMGSASNAVLKDTDPSSDFADHTYADKIRLGWTYHFTSLSRLHLSLSHELTFGRFGGGNVQFITFF